MTTSPNPEAGIYEAILIAEGLGTKRDDTLGIPEPMLAAYGSAILESTTGDTPVDLARTATFKLLSSGVLLEELDFSRWEDVTAVMSGPLFGDHAVVEPTKPSKLPQVIEFPDYSGIEASIDIAAIVRTMEPLSEREREILLLGQAGTTTNPAFDLEATRVGLDELIGRSIAVINTGGAEQEFVSPS